MGRRSTGKRTIRTMRTARARESTPAVASGSGLSLAGRRNLLAVRLRLER